ncbi:glycosyltransferase family 2 protein [candidate division KSB1 bacterium]|nr:glycosyltransferase family 2 protein [candidate division KSB1 bacterium]
MSTTEKVSDFAVIILNWNGWKDTLECLNSLTESTYQNFQIIVVDNGSTDNSLDIIRSWARGEMPVAVGPFDSSSKIQERNLVEYDQSDIDDIHYSSNLIHNSGKEDVVLIKNSSNLGFAGGNNVGIRYALKCNFDKVLLLNNDTTVDPECLRTLVEFLNHNKVYGVITPKIKYYYHPNLIWNCGGKLTIFGSRKYYYLNKKDDKRGGGNKEITFITGCALMARASIFQQYGLLSELFFLGEEDYDFSLRMKKNGVRMAAVLSAKVYHKVGASRVLIFEQDVLAKAFVHHLNRFIHLKDYYPRAYWKIWRLASLVYILPMLKKRYNVSFAKLLRYTRLLLENSNSLVSVDKDVFINAKELF